MKPELDSLGSVSGAVLGVALVLAAAFGLGGPIVRRGGGEGWRKSDRLLLFEHRGFYVPRTCIIGTPFFQEAGFTPPEGFGDAGRVMALFSRERISHVLISKFADGPDRLADWIERVEPLDAALIECQKTGRLHLIWESDRYLLLEVRQSTAPAVSQ